MHCKNLIDFRSAFGITLYTHPSPSASRLATSIQARPMHFQCTLHTLKCVYAHSTNQNRLKVKPNYVYSHSRSYPHIRVPL